MADRKAIGPIPGMSLTQTPKNAPWERPPETVDPEEALRYHINRLEDPEVMESALFFLETEEVPLTSLVKGITRSGVAKGIHNIDVSLLIAPAIHEYIRLTAEAVGIEFDEGVEDKKGKEKLREERAKVMAMKMLEDIDADIPEVEMEEEDDMEEPEMGSEPEMVEEPLMEEPKGLMSRRNM